MNIEEIKEKLEDRSLVAELEERTFESESLDALLIAIEHLEKAGKTKGLPTRAHLNAQETLKRIEEEFNR